MPNRMTANELREKFLSFFAERGHLRQPAASLIPSGDPTLLLTNSGMAQFKAYFTGELKPPRGRITTAQKCFRTVDIEEVGDDTHLTLFEMLGNFSFGDYFKVEACEWALDLMTDVLGMPLERLYFTVYKDDDEAQEIWKGLGIPDDRIFRFGDEDNWWGPAGDEGPCGPSSEINYYRGSLDDVPPPGDPSIGRSWGPNLHPDFVELYNLVFTQFYRDLDGNDTPLPKKNIDTGMGLERTLAVLNDVESLYETDVFQALMGRVEEMSGHDLNEGEDVKRAIRVVAEHGRSAAFLIGDGVVPGNTGRGYVLRRLIRRGMLYGRKIGLDGPVLPEIAKVTGEIMGGAYPELVDNYPFIKRVLEVEEEGFARTLEFGNDVLEGMVDFRRTNEEKVAKLPDEVRAEPTRAGTDARAFIESLGYTAPRGDDANDIGQRAAFENLAKRVDALAAVHQSGGRRGNQETLDEGADTARSVTLWPNEISGDEAFLLYDTYGFPIEVTQEFLEEQGIAVDREGFREALEAQRARGRASGAAFGGDTAKMRVYEQLGFGDTPFVGYETTETETRVAAIIRDGEHVDSASEGEDVEILLDETPFYAERGGQLGDTGWLKGDGFEAEVSDTQAPYGHLNVHFAKVTQGSVSTGDSVRAVVDHDRREKIRRNHTATHLVHAALREILGSHVRQTGSVVHPDYLRFDFTHIAPMTPEEIKKVQDRVNERIRESVPVIVHYTTFGEAVEEGALAFFGDTYENEVRTIKIDAPWSYELCGGTHMDTTGGIGTFVITSETGIGAGVRRIVATTGIGTEQLISERFGALESVGTALRTTPDRVGERVRATLDELATARRKVQQLENQLLQASVGGNSDGHSDSFSMEIGGKEFRVDVSSVPASGVDALRKAGDHLRDKIGSGVVVLGSVIDEKPVVIVMATKDLAGEVVHAGNVAKRLAGEMGGGGGGRPDVAQAGGKDGAALDPVLGKVREIIEEVASAGAEK